MKQGYETLTDLAVELDRRLATMDDYRADTRRMSFHVAEGSTPVLSIDAPPGEDDAELMSLPVNDYAQGQIAGRLGIPQRFFDRMRDDHPDILEDTVGKLFQREPETRTVRTLDGNVRAFLSNRYRFLDNYQLMDKAVMPALHDAGGAMSVFSIGLTDTRLYLKVVFPEITEDIRGDGSTVSPGICISNSEVGSGALAVEPFTYTWACTNGMLMGYRRFADFGIRKQHVGRAIEDTEQADAIFRDSTRQLTDEAFFAQAYDVIRNASEGVQFAAIVAAIRTAAGIEVEADPVQMVERIAKQHTVTEDEQASIMRHLVKGGDLSAWGYVSAITRAAEDVASYDRATELERLGGKLVEAPASAWKTLAAA